MENDKSEYSEQAEALWQRIKAFAIDDPSEARPFSARLAAEQCWTSELTAAVIEEYKRFLFLAVIADHPVTPSATVDKVWHFHLKYSESCWEEFCATVLGQVIHHNTADATAANAARFAQQYERTLQAYRIYFGDPPLAIWGPGNGRNNGCPINT